MTAEIIPFPGLIERVARLMLPVMEEPPGEQRDDVFGQVTTDLGVGLEDGLDLSAEQWAAPCGAVFTSSCRTGGGPVDSSIFRPKGPLLLFLADFERDTVGWREADKFRYLRVLDHIFHQGGFIPDDDDYLADIMGFRKGRGWREAVALIRSKLTRLDLAESETKAFANDLLTALQTVRYSICLTQKRILLDVKKTKDRAAKSAKGGYGKAGTNPAPSSGRAVPPYLSLEEREEEGAGAPRRYAFEGVIIRLNSDVLETWRRRFHNIPNIEATLTNYDTYLADQPEKERKRWFHRTPAWLEKKDAEYAAKITAGERVAAI